jgi:hypothetical protein
MHMKEYLHITPGGETTANPWPCRVAAEARIACGGREILCVVSAATVGSACVGTGTLGYLYVPGFIVAWRARNDDAGRPVSFVEPVDSDADRAMVRKILADMYPGLQVCF